MNLNFTTTFFFLLLLYSFNIIKCDMNLDCCFKAVFLTTPLFQRSPYIFLQFLSHSVSSQPELKAVAAPKAALLISCNNMIGSVLSINNITVFAVPLM